jgi:6-pyruvoyltetrahydropterin/6-carboxytetrahydropterin synthase
MFQIARDKVFSASHQLRGYQGRCERLHGHNWRVRVHLAAAELDDTGMVIDFHDLDRIMTEILDPFEHRHLNDVPPFDKINPSSENLAELITKQVQAALTDPRVWVCACDVWENDLSRARFVPDNPV